MLFHLGFYTKITNTIFGVYCFAMNFFKNILAAILGNLIAFGFLFVLLLMGIAGLATLSSMPSEDKQALEANSVLRLQLNKKIYDRVPAVEQFNVGLGFESESLGLDQILHSIQTAAEDTNIEGISLESQFIHAGWSQTRSIRRALQAFKEKGKFVYAYGDFFTQKSYYLASVADSVFLNPVGQIEFKGLSSEILYYKDFQDEYGVRMEVIRLGKYKSAVEPYLDNKMSAENRLQIKSLLDDLWAVLAQEMADSRALSREALDIAANALAGNTPERAQESGLIDAVRYENAYFKEIEKQVGEEANYVSLSAMGSPKSAYDNEIKDRIAVLYAQGTILYSEGSETVIGKTVFIEALEEALENPRVKAIVVRINSPGGDALTSEIIWERLEAAQEKKPLYVSMGDVAASGGYYISLPAEKIIADPLSITGSIGVWATLPNVKQFTDDIGINAEQVSTHKNAMGYSPFEKPSQGFRNAAEESIAKVYSTFKERVSAGRSMDINQVEVVAQGRVWSGTQAFQKGLVDGLGDLHTAIAMAANAAEVERYNVVSYPNITPDLETILSEGFPLLKLQWQNSLSPFWKQLLFNPSKSTRFLSIQTQLPFEINIY